MTSHQAPQTWIEARAALRKELHGLVNDPSFGASSSVESQAKERNWIDRDLDVYLGSLPISLFGLVLSVLALQTRIHDVPDSAIFLLERRVYEVQIGGSAFIFLATIAAIVLLWRRRWISAKEGRSHQIREIMKYLTLSEKLDEEGIIRSDILSKPKSQCDGGIPECAIVGNSLKDIYPVYRPGSGTSSSGTWHNIPALLLTKGDCIALQIGDIAPARCTPRSMELGRAELARGETVTVESISANATEIVSSLPGGRTTVPSQSPHLLTMCNSMTIYTVMETPILGFLRRPEREWRVLL